MTPNPAGPVQPWWRIGIVWLAFGGPALAVVGCLVTLALAISGADRPLPTSADATGQPSAAPAVQARNHAATPQR